MPPRLLRLNFRNGSNSLRPSGQGSGTEQESSQTVHLPQLTFHRFAESYALRIENCTAFGLRQGNNQDFSQTDERSFTFPGAI